MPTGLAPPATAAVLARCTRVHAAAAAAARNSSDRRGPPAAVRAVPIKLISVAKGNSPGAALMAGTWFSHVFSAHDVIITSATRREQQAVADEIKPHAEEWADKVRRYAPLTELRLKPNPRNAASPSAAVEAESQQIMRLLSAQVAGHRRTVLTSGFLQSAR